MHVCVISKEGQAKIRRKGGQKRGIKEGEGWRSAWLKKRGQKGGYRREDTRKKLPPSLCLLLSIPTNPLLTSASGSSAGQIATKVSALFFDQEARWGEKGGNRWNMKKRRNKEWEWAANPQAASLSHKTFFYPSLCVQTLGKWRQNLTGQKLIPRLQIQVL